MPRTNGQFAEHVSDANSGLRLAFERTCLWWRYTYRFQLAHGPLCERFRRDVVSLGTIFVCRSCLLLYVTLFISLVGLVALKPEPRALQVALLGLGPSTIGLSFPALYRRLPRLVRDLLRASSGLLVAMALAVSYRGEWSFGAGCLGAFLVLFYAYSRIRARIRASSCAGCTEFADGAICTGYTKQAALIRSFEERMTDLVEEKLQRSLLLKMKGN